MSRLIKSWGLICFVLLLLPALAHGNGCYIPETAVPTLPKIPLQRAIIVYRNGTETLIVESAFDTPSHQVGWILPIPAAPTSIAPAEPGIVTSAMMSLRPRILHDENPQTLAYWTLGAAFYLALLIITKKPHGSFVPVLLLLIPVALFVAMLLPSLGGAGLAPGELASLSATPVERIGNYSVTVLTGTAAEPVETWLAAEGFAKLTPQGEEAIRDYVAHGWRFVVAKLLRPDTGTAMPHPLRVTFPAAAPIFPMKLTALADTPTQVDLCVISDTRAAAAGFDCIVADRFEVVAAAREGVDYPPFYAADATGVIIGSPDVREIMWTGCFVTHLSATLSPAQMHDDITITPQGMAAHRQYLFSDRFRRQLAQAVLAWGGIAVCLVALWIWRERRKATPRQKKLLLAVAAAAPLASVLVYLILPVTPVVASRDMSRGGESTRLSEAGMAFLEMDFGADVTPQQAAEFPKRALQEKLASSKTLTNPFTGKFMTLERSPGNFSLRRIGDEAFFCTYDIEGRETRGNFPYKPGGYLPPREPATLPGP